MRKVKKYILLCILLISIVIYFNITIEQAEKTITYFPIETGQTFNKAITSLISQNDSSSVKWQSTSMSEERHYLRQDLSLLFINGMLKGVLNKWRQDETTIEQTEFVTIKPNVFIEAISFHHGEIHRDHNITSLQQMSSDQLFIFKDDISSNKLSQKQKRQLLMKKVNDSLHKHWDLLIDHFNIKIEEYEQVALTELTHLEQRLTKDYSEQVAKKIIGQLWEGLYKNYILQVIDTAGHNFMPLILIAKDRTHLLVLYELNHEKQQLIQKIKVTD